MARKKWTIWESIKRTPEEKKWVEDQLNSERTPEELKRAILRLGDNSFRGSFGVSWNVWFDKRIGAKLVSTGDEVYFKETDEEGEYADSNFSEIKRGFIDIIKHNPQDWEIKEDEVCGFMNDLPPGEEWKPRDLVVTNRYKSRNGPHYHHYKNGFTKEEWTEIESALNYQKSNSKEVEEKGNEPKIGEDKNKKKKLKKGVKKKKFLQIMRKIGSMMIKNPL